MRTIAFFDVDETLLNTKSMFDFLDFHLSAREYEHHVDTLRALASRGADRRAINREYYRIFTGQSWTELLTQGHRWYDELRSGRRIGPPFIATTLAALRYHRSQGHCIALVSGSFRVCLQPLAEHLGADLVLCTEPEVDFTGRLTGDIGEPAIGAHKATLAQTASRQYDIPLAQCYAYADHASDLDLLEVVGHPSVVGTDSALLAHAHTRGWSVLAATELAAGPQIGSPEHTALCLCGCALAAWSLPSSEAVSTDMDTPMTDRDAARRRRTGIGGHPRRNTEQARLRATADHRATQTRIQAR